MLEARCVRMILFNPDVHLQLYVFQESPRLQHAKCTMKEYTLLCNVYIHTDVEHKWEV